MTAGRPKAPVDPGAFGILTAEQLRSIEGALYHLTARYGRRRRQADEWSPSLFLSIHREIFHGSFPEMAGRLRQTEVSLRRFNIPAPGQILYKLNDLAENASWIISHAGAIHNEKENLEFVFEQSARFHASCVVLQPFIDGNKRWARIVLNALLTDLDFAPGTLIFGYDGRRYLDAIEKAAADQPDQLATMILRGYIDLRGVYESGRY